MPDKKKVIYSIERCISHVPDACRDCAYDAGHPYNECVEMMLKDAIALLKEQEAVEPINSYGTFRCRKCKNIVGYNDGDGRGYQNNFCSKCGQAVKWE